MTIQLIMNSVMLGFGLAMDAFSVSLADGLDHPEMKRGKMLTVAGAFALFQGAMPLIGWVLVTKLANVFNAIQPAIPWTALALLLFIGGKMLYEGIFCDEESKLMMMERVLKGRMTPLLILFLCCLMPQCVIQITLGNYPVAALHGALMGVYLAVFIFCAKKYINMKNGRK